MCEKCLHKQPDLHPITAQKGCNTACTHLCDTMGSTKACSAVQVYDGSKADWKEDDACEPVNAYGASKLEAEQFLQASTLLPSHLIKLLFRDSLHVTIRWPIASRPLVGPYAH